MDHDGPPRRGNRTNDTQIPGGTVSTLLGADEIARRLGVSRATAYREMRNMVHVVVGARALRVSELAFDAYLRRRTQDPKRAGLAKRSTAEQPIKVVHPRTKPLTGSPEPAGSENDSRK